MFAYPVRSAGRGGRRHGCFVLAAIAFVFAGRSAEAREEVPFDLAAEPGTIVVRTAQRRLYLVVDKGSAIRYRIAVGMPGKQWFGDAVVDGKHLKPAWIPPKEIKKDNPKLPDLIPGGAPDNPMGAAALTLSGGKYAIHGTNSPKSIGKFASYGCIRMRNEDVSDLYERVEVGARVIVSK
jgi:lipoprotein-anchoring transpeptidase ErfK/SrfK